jgi:CheY-like chemotaxis protein
MMVLFLLLSLEVDRMGLIKTNLSILFVEDVENIRKEFSDFLQLITTKDVYTASNGLDGIEKYNKYKPDIIYTDFNMPNMNGIEMIVELKKQNPKLKFCFVTASHEIGEKTAYKIQNLKPIGIYFKPSDIMKIAKDLKQFEKIIYKENQNII